MKYRCKAPPASSSTASASYQDAEDGDRIHCGIVPLQSPISLWTRSSLSISLWFTSEHLTAAPPVVDSLLLLSILVAPKNNLSIFISASCLLLSVSVPRPDTIAGFTTIFYTLPFTRASQT